MMESKNLPDKLKYDGDLSGIMTIEALHYRLYINGICATLSLKHAALEIGVSHQTLINFCTVEGINYRVRNMMRLDFHSKKRKTKYKYPQPWKKITLE